MTAIVPAYKVAREISHVVRGPVGIVDHVVVVDDACLQGSGRIVEEMAEPRVTIVRHASNRGVGGAVKTGLERALELGADVLVKIDGDGQLDSRHIPRLIEPLLGGDAEYAKGNRFWHIGIGNTRARWEVDVTPQ